MTIEPMQDALRVKFDAASRTHFSLFLRRVMATVAPASPYIHNWHVDAIAEYLAACEQRTVRRLIINLPPRMLKSTLVSVAWPAWLLGHRPSERVMAASYAQSLALKHSTDCRAVMESRWFRRVFPELVLSDEQNTKEKFATTARGYRRAVSVGGAVIGDGGNFLIMDDPLNALAAHSRAQREAVNAWFEHSWATRLDDKQHGVMVLVMQRLHPEDLSGYLLAKGGWEHLCLPAIAPTDCRVQIGDVRFERTAGEALFAAREPLEVLERLKADIGSANFTAQYQQAPMKQVGAVLKPEWFVRAPLPYEASGRRVQSWDTGIKAGAQNDASTCATFMEHEGKHWLIDMLVVRQEYPALKRTIARHAQRFSPEVILIEDKASGQSLLQDLKRETDLPLVACVPDQDKLSRLLRVTPLMEAGKLVLPPKAPWLADFELEFFSFPDAAHDDQVDAVSQYLNWLRTRTDYGNMSIRRL